MSPRPWRSAGVVKPNPTFWQRTLKHASARRRESLRALSSVWAGGNSFSLLYVGKARSGMPLVTAARAAPERR